MPVGDGCQGCLEIGEGLDAVDFAGFDQRSNAAPGDAAFIVTGKEGVLAIEGDGADQVFDPVAVDLDAAVGQEGLQPVPVVMDVGQLFAQPGFGGDLAALSRASEQVDHLLDSVKPRLLIFDEFHSCHCALINQILRIQGILGHFCTLNCNISTGSTLQDLTLLERLQIASARVRSAWRFASGPSSEMA